MFTENVIVRMIVELPWAPAPIEQRFIITRHTAQCLHPLPRERDLPPQFLPIAAQNQAREMEAQRLELINLVTRNLAAELKRIITAAVQSRDPQNGYAPP